MHAHTPVAAHTHTHIDTERNVHLLPLRGGTASSSIPVLCFDYFMTAQRQTTLLDVVVLVLLVLLVVVGFVFGFFFCCSA